MVPFRNVSSTSLSKRDNVLFRRFVPTYFPPFLGKIRKKETRSVFIYRMTRSVDRSIGIFQLFLRSELDGIEYAAYIVLCVKYNEIERKTGTPGRKETEAPQEIDARKNCKPDAALSLC